MKSPKFSGTNLKASAGFTIFEILITLFIFMVILGLGLFVSNDFYKSYALNSDVNNLVSILQQARNRAMANINQSKHGVYIDLINKYYVIFQGNNYSSRNQAYDEKIPIHPVISLSGTNEAVFEQLTGNSNVSGTIILNDGLKTANISIQNEGRINW